MSQFDDCIIFLLAKAYQKAHAKIKKRLLTFGLTPMQQLILESLWEEEGVSAGDIGKKLVLDSATLSGVLDRMTEKEWITKETDQDDKRFLRIYPSDKAKGLRSTLSAEREQANEEILCRLKLEEKILLRRLLRDLQ